MNAANERPKKPQNSFEVILMFDKISKFVAENRIKPSDCAYHTLRNLENGGKMRVLVWNDSIARTEYVCPKCGFYSYEELQWKRPFSVKCAKCGLVIKVPKLKGKKD